MPEYKITINEKTFSVNVGHIEDDHVKVSLDGKSFDVEIENSKSKSSKTPRLDRGLSVPNASTSSNKTNAPGGNPGKGDINAPLPGAILKILVAVGNEVTEGQTVAVMEAMKMENEIEAPIAGTISKIAVKEGDTILENALIMSIG